MEKTVDEEAAGGEGRVCEHFPVEQPGEASLSRRHLSKNLKFSKQVPRGRAF